MKLSHYEIDSVFDISPLCVNVLVVENESLFFKYHKEIYNQIDGQEEKFCLSDGNKTLDLAKCSVLVDNYMDFDLSNRKVATKLYQRLKSLVEENFYGELSELMQKWGDLFDKLNAESSIAIDYDDEDVISSIFKNFGVKIYVEEGSLTEQILSYMGAMSELLGIKLFFFANLKTVLTEAELSAIYKECALNEYSLFLIENTLKPKLKEETIVLIDSLSAVLF